LKEKKGAIPLERALSAAIHTWKQPSIWSLPPHWLQVDVNLSFHDKESNSALFLSFSFLFPNIFLLGLFLPNGKAYIILDKKLLSYSFKC
jgi:hypothetical protein